MNMNQCFYYKIRKISENNNIAKKKIRKVENSLKIQKLKDRDNAMEKAASELIEFLNNGDALIQNIEKRAYKGYYNYLLFAVSLDPSMDKFCTHEHGHPYFETKYKGQVYQFTYRSLFWCNTWKDNYKPFNIKYKWNKQKTLLSVYLDWSEEGDSHIKENI